MTLSPLRYPGSKRRLVPYLRAVLPERVPLLVEPFCGGASVSLRALHEGRVDRAVIADADPLVGAFWEAVCNEPADLAAAVRAEPVSLERRQHWQAARPTDRLDRAMKCLVLNRTGFGGSLLDTVGVVGGRDRAGQPEFLDRHFPGEALAQRIEAIGALAAAGRLEARTADWRDTIREADPGALLYVDPPYWRTDARLYRTAFTESDHRDLAKMLLAEVRPWLLSYDDQPEILALYAVDRIRLSRPGVTYAALGRTATVSAGSEVLLTTLPARRTNRVTDPVVTTLRVRSAVLDSLDASRSRSDLLRAALERLAREGLPVQEASERGRTKVSVRVDPDVVDRARVEAQRRGMTLTEAVERLLLAE